MAKQEPISVSQAVKFAKSEVGKMPTLTVCGEVSGFRGPNARSGHCYFNLKDDTGALSCIVWKWTYQKAGFELKDGLEIVMTGEFDVYQGNGSLSFVAKSFTIAGEGLLRQQVAALARKLQAEGLMDESRKKPVPRFCERIIVCTSLSGSVIDDVKRTLQRRNPLVEIGCVGCQVQGDAAPATIINALRIAESYHPDCILLVRGGGSFEDLMCFNDEQLARTVASLSVPIVTGIGHEPDTSICDMVSDKRSSTPTSAAESVAPALEEIVATIEQRKVRLVSAMQSMVTTNASLLDSLEQRQQNAWQTSLDAKRQWLGSIASRKCLSNPYAVLEMNRQTLDLTSDRLFDSMPRILSSYSKDAEAIESRFNSASARMLTRYTQQLDNLDARFGETKARMFTSYEADLERQTQALQVLPSRMFNTFEHKLARQASMLDALSPLKVLGRGYSIVKDKEGHVVDDTSKVNIGQEVDIRLERGYLNCKVLDKTNL